MLNKFESQFLKQKCDKHYHGYHEYYNYVLGNTTIQSLLEIGVAWGDSLKAWRIIWPDATIDALDLHRQYDLSLEEQFKIYNIDSTNEESSRLVSSTYDMIVDDGNHNWKIQLETFNLYFDKAKKFYVIEDVMGMRSLDLLLKYLPKDVRDDAHIFESRGHKRLFKVDEYSETDSYRIMFIDKR